MYSYKYTAASSEYKKYKTRYSYKYTILVVSTRRYKKLYNYNYIALMVRTKITVHSCTAYYEEISIQKQEVDTESTVHITRT